MAQIVAIRALGHNARVRVKNQAGNLVQVSSTNDTVVDLDDPLVRKHLAHHTAIGQWVVSATNSSSGVSGSKSALPANS